MLLFTYSFVGLNGERGENISFVFSNFEKISWKSTIRSWQIGVFWKYRSKYVDIAYSRRPMIACAAIDSASKWESFLKNFWTSRIIYIDQDYEKPNGHKVM